MYLGFHFDFPNALVHYCDLRQICDCFRGLLTLTAWWAGTLNTTDWVITRKCSKLALTGPRLPKLPFRKVILGVMHLGQGKLLRGWISCVKLWSEWNCEASLWHLVINEMVCSLVTKTDSKKPTWSHSTCPLRGQHHSEVVTTVALLVTVSVADSSES